MTDRQAKDNKDTQPKGFGIEPVRVHDVAFLHYALGLNYTDLRYMLGGMLDTAPQASENRTLNPNLAILIRLLWNNLEDAPIPPEPDFPTICKRFAGPYQEMTGNRLRNDEITKTRAALMTGSNPSAGVEWYDGKSPPSPPVKKLLLLLEQWADTFGEQETFERWVQAVDQEARARGTTFEQLLRTGKWPRLQEEARFRGTDEDKGPTKSTTLDPVRVHDLAFLHYALGLNYTELRYMLGGMLDTAPQASENRTLNPNLAILVRMLWNNPEDAPIPKEPDFPSLCKRFAVPYQDMTGNILRNQEITKTRAALMTGSNPSAGVDWYDGKSPPSPPVKRLMSLLDLWANQIGEQESFERWVQAVDQEARARGTTFEQLLKTGKWPRLQEEARFREKDQKSKKGAKANAG